jgi:hypothetical protein
MKSLRLMLCAMPLMLTGCSTMSSVNWSAANPWNWFGSSTKVSEHILKKIKPVHKLHSRNTEQAAFVVLKSPSVPSVLVETSFITNPEEERLLGTAAFRQDNKQTRDARHNRPSPFRPLHRLPQRPETN